MNARTMAYSLFLSIVLLASRSAAVTLKSPTFGVPADTFVTDCELILYGKEVPLVERAGRDGYWIVKDDTSVSVNGTLAMSMSTYFPHVRVTPQVQHAVDVIEKAASVIWAVRQLNGGAVVINGVRHVAGETFELTLPDDNEHVRVDLRETGMIIHYEDESLALLYEPPKTLSVSEKAEVRRSQRDARVEAAYRGLIRLLQPGWIVLAGHGGYQYRYPLTRAADVKSALAALRRSGETYTVESSGKRHYEAFKSEFGLWLPDLVKDVVEAE